MRLFN